MFGWYQRRRFERDEQYRALVVVEWVSRMQDYFVHAGSFMGVYGREAMCTLLECASATAPKWLRCSLSDVLPEFNCDYLNKTIGGKPDWFHTSSEFWFPAGDYDVRYVSLCHLFKLAESRWIALGGTSRVRHPFTWFGWYRRKRFASSEVYRYKVIMRWLQDAVCAYAHGGRSTFVGGMAGASPDSFIHMVRPKWLGRSLEDVFEDYTFDNVRRIVSEVSGLRGPDSLPECRMFSDSFHVNLVTLRRLHSLASDRWYLAAFGS